MSSYRNEIILCSSLSLRYTVSVCRSTSKYTKTNGYYNSAKFYLYSPVIKAHVGKHWRCEYAPPKKALRENSAPNVKPAGKALIAKALKNLLIINCGISPVLKKKLKRGVKEVTMNQNELFVFWLTRYHDIAHYDTSVRTDDDRQAIFALLCPYIGSFDLSRLCTNNVDNLKEACLELASGIKKSMGISADKSTSGTLLKTKIIRYAVTLYLEEKNINYRDAIQFLLKFSTPKQGVYSKVSENMRPRILSLNAYHNCYEKLSSNLSDENLALMLMLFVGLSPEEVCGLNYEDLQPITGYRGFYHLMIIHEYVKKNNEYIHTNLEDENKYRYIPVPSLIFKALKTVLSNNLTCEPKSPLLSLNGERLKPDYMKKSIEALLKPAQNVITVEQDNKLKNVDISFKPSSYRESCRAYWHNHCGLHDGEIRYLSGLTALDTVSIYYIDFNNASMQYRMLIQMDYGIAMIAAESMENSVLMPLQIKKSRFSGRLRTKAGMKISVTVPAEFSITSDRGVVITQEVN